jgi:hypothetical protein
MMGERVLEMGYEGIRDQSNQQDELEAQARSTKRTDETKEPTQQERK